MLSSLIPLLVIKGDKNMKKLLAESLAFASLLTLGAGAVTVVPSVAKPVTVKAAADYGLTGIGLKVVQVRDTAAQLYDAKGQPLGRYLPMGSRWKTETENTLASGSYFEVGGDEFLKSADINMSDAIGGQGLSRTNYDGVEITIDGGAAIYDVEGHPIGRTLPEGSDWRVDYENTIPSGTYYRVASGEFVKATEVRVYQDTIVYPEHEVITTRPGAPKTLYDGNGQVIGSRALGPNTKWFTDQFADIGHAGFYRVATDEYVSDVDVY